MRCTPVSKGRRRREQRGGFYENSVANRCGPYRLPLVWNRGTRPLQPSLASAGFKKR